MATGEKARKRASTPFVKDMMRYHDMLEEAASCRRDLIKTGINESSTERCCFVVQVTSRTWRSRCVNIYVESGHVQQRKFDTAALRRYTRRNRGAVELDQTGTNQADALGLLSLSYAACLDVAVLP